MKRVERTNSTSELDKQTERRRGIPKRGSNKGRARTGTLLGPSKGCSMELYTDSAARRVVWTQHSSAWLTGSLADFREAARASSGPSWASQPTRSHSEMIKGSAQSTTPTINQEANKKEPWRRLLLTTFQRTYHARDHPGDARRLCGDQ